MSDNQKRGARGRPAEGSRMYVRIPEDQIAVLDDIADASGVDRSKVVRAAIADRVALERVGLHAWAQARADGAGLGFGAVAAELAAAREVYRAELARQPFTTAELCLIAEVLNGTLVSPGVGQVAFAEVADACASARSGPLPSPYGDRWGTDEDALVEKLRHLGPAADLALRHAIARFWSDPDADGRDAATWSALGFTVEP